MHGFEALKTALAGRYALERPIGAGGMAHVYLAQDLKHDRPVAIKVLRPELAATLGTERFLREIAIAARLQHPHILPLFDSGILSSESTGDPSGPLYYVMPFVPEESLRTRLSRELRLPPGDVLRIAGEVASALDYAHAASLIHRDIKPENILLPSGRAVVTDFGIARAIEEAADQRLTVDGFGLGTPIYASPEQTLGERNLDGRCDVYSLACVVYEMLCGVPPFTGPTPLALLARKSTELPPRLAVSGFTPSAPMEAAIRRALDRDPEQRFPTAGAFVQAMVAGGSIEAHLASDESYQGAPRAIAVLPFENLSRDPADEYLSDGLSEELIHALGGVTGLRVIARTSSFAFKGTGESIRGIARRLGVDTVLEGSVQRAGDRLRIRVRAVDGATEFERWAERYDRPMDDVFTMQDEIAAAVVRTVVGARPAVIPRPPTADLGAYTDYLRGRHFWNARTEAGLSRSIGCLEAAVARDPRFALAHAGLADLHVTLALYGAQAPEVAAPAALTAAEAALALGGAEAEALTARGCARAIFQRAWAESAADFERALALKPQYPPAYQWYAINCLAPQGRLAEADARLAAARDLDPLSPVVTLSVGLLHHFAGRDEQAIATFDGLLELDPRSGMAHYFRGQALLGQARLDEAVSALTRAVELADQSPETLAYLGYALALRGEGPKARAIRARLLDRARERYVSPVLLAQIDVGLGDLDAAFRELERAATGRAVELIWLPVRPAFERLRSDPRYPAFAASLPATAGAR